MRYFYKMIPLISAALLTPELYAYEQGDFIIRAGAAEVQPNSDSHDLYNTALGDLPGKVKVDNDTQLGLTFTYMLQDHLGLELLAATPFTHEVKMSGSLSILNGKLGDVSHLPPTLMLQWYPMNTQSLVQPYLGLGVNYTIFFDEQLSDQYKAQGFSNLKLESSWGLAGQAGIDYQVSEHWLLNAAVWYIDIDTTATMDNDGSTIPALAGSKTSADVAVDPWVYMLGVGYRF